MSDERDIMIDQYENIIMEQIADIKGLNQQLASKEAIEPKIIENN